MKPLVLKDIDSIEAYEAKRQAMRQQIIALKRIRRVRLGPRVSVVFENRDTMRFQIQEMCRIEHIVEESLVQQEIDVYNDLLPEGLAIGATLLIELVQEDDMPAILRELSGLEEAVWLSFGEHHVHAEAEAGRSTEEKTSSVHYLTFRFTPTLRHALIDAPEVRLSSRHPHYRHDTVLSRETVASLVHDLTSE
ncbi:MAG: DUF3501 domain-containing protein [Sulfobacillus acidophilus]|uniref:DUF3501 domain-containing protein n=1 Tax=Sulfobacillus acidophilus TaxID=53633 RepID=A0A2T2WMR9_9FIRM|nr:MAG: DUF3501 domain-containing protein [Sulfobacillus acidophilus]